MQRRPTGCERKSCVSPGVGVCRGIVAQTLCKVGCVLQHRSPRADRFESNMISPEKPALSRSESERLHQFISSVTDYAIYMLTPEGNVASWNAGAQRFKGYTADEIVGKHFSLFYT